MSSINSTSGAVRDTELLVYLDRCFVRFAGRPALRRESTSGDTYQLSYADVLGRCHSHFRLASDRVVRITFQADAMPDLKIQ